MAIYYDHAFPHSIIAKEFTEYSIQELAAITDCAAKGPGLSFLRQQSDNFHDYGYPELRAAPITFCEERAEYSAQELGELMGTALSELHVQTSDDFEARDSHPRPAQPPGSHLPAPAGFKEQQASPTEGVRDLAAQRPRRLCKEHTEYSARELELLSDAPVLGRESSDDFVSLLGEALPPSTFVSWYHKACLVPTDGSIKRARRVYHNRRKTSWTDYDEEPPAAQKASGNGEAAREAQPSRLMQLLKAGGAAPTREAVREAALGEAASRQGGGGVAGVLAAPGPCGWAPLLVAVQRKQEAAVAALLELGADAGAREPCCGWTALMYAAGAGHRGLVEQLLACGADADARAPRNNWSPLCSAVQSGEVGVVRALLDAGADLQMLKRWHPAIWDIYTQDMGHLHVRPQTRQGSGTNSMWVKDASLHC